MTGTSRTLRLRGLAALMVAASLAFPVGAAAATAGRASVDVGPLAAPIEPTLVQDLTAGRTRTLIVEFAATADLRVAARIPDHLSRGQAVIDVLTATAASSQRGALALTAGEKGVTATTYWISNVLAVEGDPAALLALAPKLARLSGVERVRREDTATLDELVDPATAIEAALAAEEEIPWGIARIGAPRAWASGILGQGVVVANIDTGVDFSHEALVGNYRGNDGDGTFTHDHNWWDATGRCPTADPCDGGYHGTHLMGTSVGGDGPGPFTPDIGVAPGARWIAARAFSDTTGTETDMLSAGQFMLAPTDLAGNDPQPGLRPDVINNSWHTDPDADFFEDVIDAWRASGIIPVFAAGNTGSTCESGGYPGNSPKVISVGSVDIDEQVAGSSGRGPSPDGKINPDVAAPGVDINSALPGNGYGLRRGTSMAAPHVAGAAALVLAANQDLLGDPGSFDVVRGALTSTAVDHIDMSCGGDDDGDPNNVYGDGRIDAAAAAFSVFSGGTLSGTVSDGSAAPIGGATVTAGDGTRSFSSTTDASGHYEIRLKAGAYTVSATAFGYGLEIVPGVAIVNDQTTDQDLVLILLPTFTVSGRIRTAEDSSPIEAARVGVVGAPVEPVTSDAAGEYHLVLPIGLHTLRASSTGCTEIAFAEIDSSGTAVTQDFDLFRKLDDFGHVCVPIAFDWVDATTQSGLFGDNTSGRQPLPFPFEFYGKTYDAVLVSEDGHLDFGETLGFNTDPQPLPSKGLPGPAIYPFWKNMVIGVDSDIETSLVGESPNRAFVVEYTNMQIAASEADVDFEVKLWEDGTIDLLYGSNDPDPGDGRDASIGIEDGPNLDGLRIGFHERILDPNQAIRITRTATGQVGGTVTDANDSLPLDGAVVTATPGGRTVKTDADGTYSLRLLPGSYTISAAFDGYVGDALSATVTDDGSVTRDFALAAPAAAVDPREISLDVDFGEVAGVDLTVSNGGSLPLAWSARERQTNPVAPAGVGTDIGSTAMTVILEDPIGDNEIETDIVAIRGGSDGFVLSMAVDYSAASPMSEAGAFIYLDIDQDPTTGIRPHLFSGLPTQDIGAEYLLHMFLSVLEPDPFATVLSFVTEEETTVPVRFDGQSMLVDVPLTLLEGDDGQMDTVVNAVEYTGTSDYAPEVGHATIVPFTEVSWLSAEPESGTVAVDGDDVIHLSIGERSLPPGTHEADVIILTNAPKSVSIPINVTLEVARPAEFGDVTGVVTDAHTGGPLDGATVTLHAIWPPASGTALDIVGLTAPDGTYSLQVPQGAWSADVTMGGFVAETGPVAVSRGETTAIDWSLHRIQPHAALGGDAALVVTLLPDDATTTTFEILNPGGHADLTFEITERVVALAGTIPAAIPADTDVTWLSVTPTSGTVAADGTAAVEVAVESTGLLPGLYLASIDIATNDPDEPVISVPVTLMVPAYQQGINAGGTDVVTADGTILVSDREYRSSPAAAARSGMGGPTDVFGWVGKSNARTTAADIAGTVDERLYLDLRQGATSYRFTVPDGTYTVRLDFAELDAKKPLERVFGISLEGVSVDDSLDVFAESGGRNTALQRSYIVTVSDGVLDIDFAMPKGHKSIVSAILVTERPFGSPGG